MGTFGAPTGDARARAARNLFLTDELLRIARAFEAAGLDLVILKGVPLAHRLFGAVSARNMVDNDVLVRPRQVDRAVGVLRDCGYAPAYPSLTPEAEFRRTNEYPMVRRPPGRPPAWVDVHVTGFHAWFFAVPEAVEWAHVQPFALNDMTVRVFDEPLTLLHLAAHFAQHTFSEAWILRDVAAAWNVWGRDLALDDLLGLGRETGTRHVLEFALRAAEDVGLVEIPPALRRSSRVAMLRRLLPADRLFERRPVVDHRRRMLVFLLTGVHRAPRYLASAMFPTVERMSVIYGAPASARLYLRYAGRPFRALGRALRGR